MCQLRDRCLIAQQDAGLAAILFILFSPVGEPIETAENGKRAVAHQDFLVGSTRSLDIEQGSLFWQRFMCDKGANCPDHFLGIRTIASSIRVACSLCNPVPNTDVHSTFDRLGDETT